MLKELRSRGVTHVYLCGLALDVCVTFSALHCAEEGFVTTVVVDACAGVTNEGIADKLALMTKAGIQLVQSTEVCCLRVGAVASPSSARRDLRVAVSCDVLHLPARLASQLPALVMRPTVIEAVNGALNVGIAGQLVDEVKNETGHGAVS